MAEKNTIEKIVNYSNRRFFEGLLDYIANPIKTLKYMFSPEGSRDNAGFSLLLFQDAFLSKYVFPLIWSTRDEVEKKPDLSEEVLLKRHAKHFYARGISSYGYDIDGINRYNNHKQGILSQLTMHEKKGYICLVGDHNPKERRYISRGKLYFTKGIFGLLAGIHFIIALPFTIPGLRYFTNLALRLALLPLTSVVYCVSRLAGVVLKPGASDHNYVKALFMRIVTAAAALTLAIKVPMISFGTFASNLGLEAGLLGMSAATVGGLMVGGIAVIGFALLLYGAKTLAQDRQWKAYRADLGTSHKTGVHKPDIKSVLVTAPKHQTQSKDPEHIKALVTYYYLKQPAIVPPSQEALRAKEVLESFESPKPSAI